MLLLQQSNVIELGIALPLDSLLLRGVSKHARHHAHPRDGLKAGPALAPRNNRLSSGRAMGIP